MLGCASLNHAMPCHAVRAVLYSTGIVCGTLTSEKRFGQ